MVYQSRITKTTLRTALVLVITCFCSAGILAADDTKAVEAGGSANQAVTQQPQTSPTPATAPVSTQTKGALTKGKQLTIDFKNSAEKTVSIPLSLDGFAAAYDKIARL